MRALFASSPAQPGKLSKHLHIDLRATLDRVLRNDAATDTLLAAMQRQRCDEGLAFALAVRAGMPADLLMSTYILDQASSQISLASDTRANLIRGYESHDEALFAETLHCAVDDVLTDMKKSDTFSKFVQTYSAARSLLVLVHNNIVVTDAMISVIDTMASSGRAKALLNSLAAKSASCCRVAQVRFLMSMLKLDAISLKHSARRQARERKIVSLFIGKDSKFHLESVSQCLVAQLLLGKFFQLEIARLEVVEDLSKAPDVVQAIEHISRAPLTRRLSNFRFSF